MILKKCMSFPTNKSMKRFSMKFKNFNLKFVEKCCLLRLKILPGIQNKNIETKIYLFLENGTKFDLTYLYYLPTLNQN